MVFNEDFRNSFEAKTDWTKGLNKQNYELADEIMRDALPQSAPLTDSPRGNLMEGVDITLDDLTLTFASENHPSGIPNVAANYIYGIRSELQQNPDKIVLNGGLGLGIAAAARTGMRFAPITSKFALVGLGVYSLYEIGAAAPSWLSSISTAFNPERRTREEVFVAEQRLQQLGADSVNMLVGGAGGAVGWKLGSKLATSLQKL